MKEWDNGYLVVMAKYKYNNKPEEEYMTIEYSQSVHSIVVPHKIARDKRGVSNKYSKT